MQYNTVPTTDFQSPLWQQDPKPYVSARLSPSWTRSLADYHYASDRLAKMLWRNHELGQRLRWLVSLNIHTALTPDEDREFWKSVCRNLSKAGLVALYVREPNRQGHINYHLSIVNDVTEEELRCILEQSLPSRGAVPYALHVEKIANPYQWCRYVCKAKTPGLDESGRLVEDKWADKRLLFKPHTGLKKHGTIGKFWVKPEKRLWQEGKDVKKKAKDGQERDGIHRVIRAAVELVGDCVKPSAVRFSIGYFADSPAIVEWAKALDEEATVEPLPVGNTNNATDAPPLPVRNTNNTTEDDQVLTYSEWLSRHLDEWLDSIIINADGTVSVEGRPLPVRNTNNTTDEDEDYGREVA